MMETQSAVRIVHVSFEHHREAFGIGEAKPRISWRFEGTSVEWHQDSYDIEVRRDDTPRTEIYSISAPESTFVPWPSSPLLSGGSATLRVRAHSEAQGWTSWSDHACVEAGLLSTDDWSCALIQSQERDLQKPHRPIIFRRWFRLDKPILRARLYISAHGLYETKINGHVIGDQVLSPGWTSYQHELPYQTFDILPHLKKGVNIIGAEVAEGWYCGRIGFLGGLWNCWGDTVGLIAQMVITHVDGMTETIGTDSKWTFNSSPTISAEIYDGETFDSRLQGHEWSNPGYDDSAWERVYVTDHDTKLLRAPDGPPIRRVREIKPQTLLKTPSGKTLIDFGQNLVGWVRVKVKGRPGQIVSWKHGEALEHGELLTRTLRYAKATDALILSGEELVWEPRFTFHGFRYIELDDWPEVFEDVKLESFTAINVHTDMERTGWFECSEPMLNKLHENVLWSMRGNFIGVPTDCPQRDERLGYTGDFQAFAPTASFLYNPYGMLKGWLRSVALEQKEEGNGVPGMFAPNPFRASAHQACAIWGDCTIMGPWDLYQSSGDVMLLKDQYESMKDWLENGITRDSRNMWDPSVYQLGDWLDPTTPPDDAGNGQTDSMLVANAFLIRVTELMVQVCERLGLSHDARQHRVVAEAMRRIFLDEYVTRSGRVVSDSQTAFALAIQFSLLEDDQMQVAATRLVKIIETKDHFRIGTGFAGTPIIGHALTKVGMTSVFYRMLQGTECPSWLYPVTMGATTIWERWNSMLPDGTINPSGMTSFNHYALGSVADWMHKVIGGLAPLEPGWKKFLIRPIPGGSLTFAKATFLSPYGMIRTAWHLELGTLHFRVEVPPNTTAIIQLPGQDAREVGSGIYALVTEYPSP